MLADGMGGYNAGEIASGMAVAFIKSELSRWLSQAVQQASPKEVRRAMEICVENTNLSILKAAHANSQYAGMGTTLVVGVFQRDLLILGHIGDSRCYRLRGGVLAQITRDHSLLQEQIDAGLISAEEAITSTHKNLVTRALGVEGDVQLEVHVHPVAAGDVYLLCSDGLTDMVSDAGIARIFSTAASLEAIADGLVDAANANGGRDNISVLITQVGGSDEKRGLIARLLGK